MVCRLRSLLREPRLATARAVSTLRGHGMPWLMIVLSSATSGRPSSRAASTDGDSDIGSVAFTSTGSPGKLDTRTSVAGEFDLGSAFEQALVGDLLFLHQVVFHRQSPIAGQLAKLLADLFDIDFRRLARW